MMELNLINRLALNKTDMSVYEFFIEFCRRKEVLPEWNSPEFAFKVRQLLAKLIRISNQNFCIVYKNMNELMYDLQVTYTRATIQRYLTRAQDTKTIDWYSSKKGKMQAISLNFAEKALNEYPNWYEEQLAYTNEQVYANV